MLFITSVHGVPTGTWSGVAEAYGCVPVPADNVVPSSQVRSHETLSWLSPSSHRMSDARSTGGDAGGWGGEGGALGGMGGAGGGLSATEPNMQMRSPVSSRSTNPPATIAVPAPFIASDLPSW